MCNDKIINLETYEIIDDNSKFIIVDSLIADTIVLLNKLGYKTTYCCSGHSFPQKKELFIKETRVDFNEVVEQLTELVTNVFVPNDMLKVVNKIVEKHLGTGQRVADATEEQADALQLILDELIMYAEENNLK